MHARERKLNDNDNGTYYLVGRAVTTYLPSAVDEYTVKQYDNTLSVSGPVTAAPSIITSMKSAETDHVDHQPDTLVTYDVASESAFVLFKTDKLMPYLKMVIAWALVLSVGSAILYATCCIMSSMTLFFSMTSIVSGVILVLSFSASFKRFHVRHCIM